MEVETNMSASRDIQSEIKELRVLLAHLSRRLDKQEEKVAEIIGKIEGTVDFPPTQKT